MSGHYAPFILGPAGGGPGVGALPFFGAPPLFLVLTPVLETNKSGNVKKKKFINFRNFASHFFKNGPKSFFEKKVPKSPETPRKVEKCDKHFLKKSGTPS